MEEACVIPKTQGILFELDGLDTRVSNLVTAVDFLSKKISPVLIITTKGQSQTAKDKSPSTPSSVVAEKIKELALLITECEVKLNSIADNLDI